MLFRIPEGRNPLEDVGVDRRVVLKGSVRSEDLELIYLLHGLVADSCEENSEYLECRG